MKMFVAGEWVAGTARVEVTSPYSGEVIDTVPRGTRDDIDRALAVLTRGAATMRGMAAHERGALLLRAAARLKERAIQFAETIAREEGKILAEARLEVDRAHETLVVSAEEAKRIAGEMVPLEGAPGVRNTLGFTLRVPCGIVGAISPYNFPLNLVAHKVGPALAAGNAVLLKPASDTPLTALLLVEVLLEIGFPPEALACVTGPGSELGRAIAEDRRVRKVSFTGSYEVGAEICRVAGVKRVTMELGSNSPVVILDDADLEQAAAMVASSGYANAGQVCISAQRIVTQAGVHGDFLDALRPRVAAIRTGDPLNPETAMGPMIRARDAERVEQWVREAVAGGAQVVTGGERQGAVYPATILDGCTPEMRVVREELFGPAVAVLRCTSVEEGIRLANDTRYGLSAAVFTRDLEKAFRFVREVDAGSLHVNWGTQWRADLMPYGGLRDSGLGKEGPRYAIREMTEEKLVVLHL